MVITRVGGHRGHVYSQMSVLEVQGTSNFCSLTVSLSELLFSDGFSNPHTVGRSPAPRSLRTPLEQVRPSFLSVMQTYRDWPLFVRLGLIYSFEHTVDY